MVPYLTPETTEARWPSSQGHFIQGWDLPMSSHMNRYRVLALAAGAAVAAGAVVALLALSGGSLVELPRTAEAVTNPFTGQRAALILADTTLPEGTDVRFHYWIGAGGVLDGASHAPVTDGTLPIYIDVPDCSPGWAESWDGRQFSVSAVPGHDFGARVTEAYHWPSNVCG